MTDYDQSFIVFFAAIIILVISCSACSFYGEIYISQCGGGDGGKKTYAKRNRYAQHGDRILNFFTEQRFFCIGVVKFSAVRYREIFPRCTCCYCWSDAASIGCSCSRTNCLITRVIRGIDSSSSLRSQKFHRCRYSSRWVYMGLIRNEPATRKHVKRIRQENVTARWIASVPPAAAVASKYKS